MVAAFAARIKIRLDERFNKRKALYKLSKLTKKVGYPDKWKDFSKLVVDRSSFARNTLNANEFWFNRDIKNSANPWIEKSGV